MSITTLFAQSDTLQAAEKHRANGSACSIRVADGSGVSENVAKFQVFEGILKATDVSLWATWMAEATTPGYAIKNVKYRCHSGAGLGVACRGQARVCRIAKR
jgi:hypothetical protein